MITRRRMAKVTALPLLLGPLSNCMQPATGDSLETDYNQLYQRLSGEISRQQVHITRLPGAIKIAVNSALLFPSGGWEMPPAATRTVARMVPVLAPLQSTRIVVTGYANNALNRQQGTEPDLQLSFKRAQAVMQFFIEHGIDPTFITAQAFEDGDTLLSNDTAQDGRLEITLVGASN